MRPSRAGPFRRVASVAMAAMASFGANAAIDAETAYGARLVVPAFVKDVRAVVVDGAVSRGWVVVDERPGEVTLELKHARSHMTVLAKAYYSQEEIRFERVSARTYECKVHMPCAVDPEVVQRWMIGLRREAGVALLRLAIQDAGGSVGSVRAAAAEADAG